MTIFFWGTANAETATKTGLSASSQQAKPLLSLTKEEQQWLSEHRSIRIAYDASLPPYSFVNEQGKIEGVAAEIMTLLGQRLGVHFLTYADTNWQRLYTKAATRKVDMVATMVSRADRTEKFIFTKPYLTKSLVIVTKQDNSTINNRDDLKDKKIAVIAGYQYAEQIISEFPNSKSTKVDTMLDSLKAVDNGHVDAAILFLGSANYLQSKYQLTRLKIAAFYDRNSADESIAVRKDWPIFAGILQKGLDSLAEEEVQNIFSKWVTQAGSGFPSSTASKNSDLPVASSDNKKTEKQTKPVAPSSKNTLVKPKQVFPEGVDPVTVTLFIFGLFLLYVFQAKKQKWQKETGKRVLKQSKSKASKAPPKIEDISTQPSMENSENEISIEPKSEQPIQVDTEQLLQVIHTEQPAHPEAEMVPYQRNTKGQFTYISPTISKLLGYSASEFIQNFSNYLTDNPLNQRFESLVDSCIQGQPVDPYEMEVYDASNNRRWLELSGTAVYDGQGHCTGIEGIIRDITTSKLYNESLVKGSLVSSVTEKFSLQQPLQDQLELAIKSANKEQKTFALLRLSLERLRLLDGNLLDNVDSEIFTEAGKRLRATLRDTDTVFELDSDQFVLILPDTDGQKANLIVDKVRKILQVPYLVGIHSIVLDAVIGIAIYPEHGLEPEYLVNKTHEPVTSLPNEEATLPPQVHYENQGGDLKLQQDLVLALDECKVSLRAMNPHNINALYRHSQLSIYYQSQHNIKDFGIVGVEALIRWQHPELGLLLPKDFVELIKNIGLLDVMTHWVIQQVSFQAMEWDKKGIRPKSFVINLGDFLGTHQNLDVDKITQIVTETGAKPKWFTFSIPENLFVKYPDLVMNIVNQLVMEGFVVAIDNYVPRSTLQSELKTIPAQVIELNPDFTRFLNESEPVIDFITNTIEILHEMGKTVIAKEIEREQQLEFLKTSGCDVIQGHLLSKPLSAKEAKDVMETLPNFVWYLRQ